MSFRNIHDFNKALLTKQVWRLTKYPDSLVVCSLKARYYAKVDVMEAKVPSYASFMWRSLCRSRDLLAKGIRWKIGDGKSIKVFKDAWVPGFNSGILISKPMADPDMTINSLITGSKEWDLGLLNFHFLLCEIFFITELDLSSCGGPDIR